MNGVLVAPQSIDVTVESVRVVGALGAWPRFKLVYVVHMCLQRQSVAKGPAAARFEIREDLRYRRAPFAVKLV